MARVCLIVEVAPPVSGTGHTLLSVLQLLSSSLSFVSFISLATVLLNPSFGNGNPAEVLALSAGCLGGGDSLESDRCKLSRPFRRTLLRFIRSLFSGRGGEELLLSDSGGSTRNDSPSESREPLIGVGIMLIRLGGMFWCPF